MTEPKATAVDGEILAADPDWWRQAAVYQIYPRSFADANGDGIGDLKGITSRVPYLAELGVEAVWLSPFYPSALADGGYDVDDYRDVDPKIGTLDDFDEMVAALHGEGIRLIVDIVPNHSSNLHEWFQAALAAGPGSPERERYHFRGGKGPDGAEPPTDWESMFGGPAWTRVPDGQWYLHLFAPEQPDWNWDHPDVRADFLATLRFWSDRGVDGFRVDVAHALSKDLADPLPDRAELDTHYNVTDGSHRLWDREELDEIYADWRAVFDEYDPPRIAVAEAWVAPQRRHRYAAATSLGQAFNFDLLNADFKVEDFRRIIADNLAFAREHGSSNTWVFSNHDKARHATRYGLPDDHGRGGQVAKEWLLTGGTSPTVDTERGLRRARAATLLMLALPGSAYLYQGEELGLPEVAEIPDADRQDPTFFRSPGVDVGRDGCRVPLPWKAAAPSFGFGPTEASHLPQPEWFAEYAVDAETEDPASTLSLYREALALRGKLKGPESLDWADLGHPDVLAFDRPGGWRSVTNFDPVPVTLPKGQILIASAPIDTATGSLPAETTVWLRR